MYVNNNNNIYIYILQGGAEQPISDFGGPSEDDMADDFTYTAKNLILRLKEGLTSFGNNHPHYDNEVFKSSDILAGMLFTRVPGAYIDVDPEALLDDLVMSVSTLEEVYKVYYWQLNGQFDKLTNKRKLLLFKGSLEPRPYYAYHNLQAVASKSFKPNRGLICPSMLCDIKRVTGEMVEMVDSGYRLMRIFMTRCASHEIWGLIYNTRNDSIQLVKDLFKRTAKSVSVNFVPFDLVAPNR